MSLLPVTVDILKALPLKQKKNKKKKINEMETRVHAVEITKPRRDTRNNNNNKG